MTDENRKGRSGTSHKVGVVATGLELYKLNDGGEDGYQILEISGPDSHRNRVNVDLSELKAAAEMAETDKRVHNCPDDWKYMGSSSYENCDHKWVHDDGHEAHYKESGPGNKQFNIIDVNTGKVLKNIDVSVNAPDNPLDLVMGELLEFVPPPSEDDIKTSFEVLEWMRDDADKVLGEEREMTNDVLSALQEVAMDNGIYPD